PLVPKLLFGNACLTKLRFALRLCRRPKRSFADSGFPNGSLGTRETDQSSSGMRLSGQRGGRKLIRRERRGGLNVAGEVLANQAAPLPALHRPDLDPGLFIQVDGHLGDPGVVRLLVTPQRVARPIPDRTHLLDAEVFAP